MHENLQRRYESNLLYTPMIILTQYKWVNLLQTSVARLQIFFGNHVLGTLLGH